MFITEILIDKQALDLYEDKALRYSLQVNTIADLKDRQANFLQSTTLPKTAKNIRLLKGLGLTSDTSPIPYIKPNCELKIDGFNFISKGWLSVDEANDDFRIKIYSGIVQFFKAIEGKKLGADLDLSEINHVKDLASVIGSFTSPYYRYLITDYNGKTHYGANNSKINIDYLVPSVNVGYLWDKIHKTFGFTYSGVLFTSSQFNNLWITYPKPIPIGSETQLKQGSGLLNVQNRNVNWNIPEQFYNRLIVSGFDNNVSFTIPENGNYRIIFECDVQRPSNAPQDAYYFMTVNQVDAPFHNRTNPINILTVTTGGSNHYRTDRVMNLQANDVIDFYALMWANGFLGWRTDYTITIKRIDDANASFSDELKDFAITDFVKDVLNMFGLTPFSNENNNNIDYRLITERLATADVIDWSKKYVRRTSEKYIHSGFAQMNYFRYQYNDKESDFHDGAIKIDNVNLSETKEIFKSKMYSPEKDLTLFNIGSLGNTYLRLFKMYDKEVKEQGGGTTINYKGLDKRFHYARSNVFPTTVVIGSETLQQETTVNSLPLIDYSGLPWQRLLDTFYYQMGRIMIDSRYHEFELSLHPTDVILLDQSKMYYFEQEQQYYVIDKIDYDGDEIAKGKFIRVKRDPDAVIIPTDPTDPTDYVIAITWGDGLTNDRIGYAQTEVVKLNALSYPASDPIVGTTWQINNGSGWVDLSTSVTPYTVALTAGVNRIRMKGTTQNGIAYYSIELEYVRQTAVCYIYEAQIFAQSGDNLDIYYSRCDTGELDVVSTHQGAGSGWLNISVCAIEGTASSNGNLTQAQQC